MPFVPLDADELRDVSTQRLRDYIWRFDAHIATIGDPVARLSAMLILRGSLEEWARREASRRRRSTKQDMFEQRQAILGIVHAMHPMTVRQVFYQATVRGIVAKTEAGYIQAQKAVAWLRRNGYVRSEWITDGMRFDRKPTSFEGPGEAIRMYAEAYRKALWTNADSYVEVWLEKDALSGVVYPVTSECDVSLMVARGYPSITFLASAAEQIGRRDVPAYIYHLGDYDPSAQDAARATGDGLRELAPGAEIHFKRIAVTPHQIEAWNLPTRPTEQSDTRAASFRGESVELDAIEPELLRGLVRRCIERHLPPEELARLKEVEAAEREQLIGFAKTFEG
jgi:hypothetical protein